MSWLVDLAKGCLALGKRLFAVRELTKQNAELQAQLKSKDQEIEEYRRKDEARRESAKRQRFSKAKDYNDLG